MKKLIVVGYGGFGREVLWLAEDCGYEVLGFLDDAVAPGAYGTYQVLGAVSDWKNYEGVHFVVAIGNPRVRRHVVNKMQAQGERPKFATLVHPSVVVSSKVTFGRGTMICAGTVGTVDFTVGNHVIVNLKCTIAHDDHIADFVTVAPLVAISGDVTLESGVEVGTAASIRQGVTMASGSTLGMGGVLTKDTDPNKVYIGSPAKPFKDIPPF